MRLALAACSALALTAPAPALAQDALGSDPSVAVLLTCQQALVRRGYPASVGLSVCAQEQAALQIWDFMFAQPFLWALEKVGIPWPQKLSNGGIFGGGSSGGGGASGSWDADCDTLVYKRDANGNIIVPSMKLHGGLAMTRGGGLGQVKGGAYAGVHYAAKDAASTALYTTHLRNIGRNTDRRRWFGAAWITGAGNYVLRSVGYYDVNNVLVSGGSDTASASGSYYYLGPTTVPTGPNEADCPAGMDGGTSHFYLQGSPTTTNAQCIWYEPNFALSPSGYLYNWETTVPGGTTSGDKANRALYLQHNPNIAACKLDEELIRKVADAYFKKITEQPGYTGPPYAPVVIDDVRVDGDPPTVQDVYRDPPADPPTDAEPEVPPPVPTPTPTPTPTGSTDPGYEHPQVDAPDAGSVDLNMPEFSFDWGLPELTLNLGSPACPIYEFDAFERHFVMDTHCQFLEANRSLVSALMVIAFTIGAAVVLLRA